MSGSLTAALNGRKGSSKAQAVKVDFDVEPVMLLADEPPRPAVEVVEGQRVRGLDQRQLIIGEVGYRSAELPVEYTEATMRAVLSRVAKDCNFVSEHLNDAEGAAQLGLLVELSEDLSALLRLHMARKVFNDNT